MRKQLEFAMKLNSDQTVEIIKGEHALRERMTIMPVIHVQVR